MSFTYRKPKDAQNAIDLVKAAHTKAEWEFVNAHDINECQTFFDFYSPILFIYKHNKLVGMAHNKFGKTNVFALEDSDVTNKYTKDQLNDFDINIRQIQLDF